MKSVIGHVVVLFALFLLLSPAVVKAQAGNTPPAAALRDSVVMQTTFYFSPNRSEWIEPGDYPKSGRLVRWAQENPSLPIRITGWADASGTAALNEKLSLRRARTIRNYLVRKGISADRITFEGCGVDGDAESPEKARRADVCGVVRIAVEATPATGKVSPPAEASPAGETSGTSVAESGTPVRKDESGDRDATGTAGKDVQTAIPVQSGKQTEQTQSQPERKSAENVQPETAQSVQPTDRQPDTDPELPSAEDIAPAKASPSSARYLGVKTNLAAWAGTIMNVAADVQVAPHWSVELPVLWCPWYIGSEHAVKTFTIQPEARYWLRQPGAGHFFGLHAHVGWFNVRWNRDRYQDTDRPLLGAGISYGYLLPFNDHWAGEFTLGAGYANMRYDTFYNIDNGARIDTRTKNYWGITRVGISLVYRFNLKK